MQPDGIATFVEYIDPAKILGSLASKLHDPRRLLVSSANLEDPQLMQTLGRKLDGVVGSTWLPSSPPSPVLRDYRGAGRCVPRTPRCLRGPFGSHRVLQRPRGNGLGAGTHSLR